MTSIREIRMKHGESYDLPAGTQRERPTLRWPLDHESNGTNERKEPHGDTETRRYGDTEADAPLAPVPRVERNERTEGTTETRRHGDTEDTEDTEDAEDQPKTLRNLRVLGGASFTAWESKGSPSKGKVREARLDRSPLVKSGGPPPQGYLDGEGRESAAGRPPARLHWISLRAFA